MSKRNKPTDVFLHLDMNPVHPCTCWLWKDGLSGKGLPYFSLDGKKVLAYRLVYKLTHPEWDIDNAREVIRHGCRDSNGVAVDNPLCCNPDHLSTGTQEQNMLDMMLRSRSGLTIEVLRDILDLHERFPEWTHRQVAARVEYKHKINVARTTVTDILRGARRKELRDALDEQDRRLSDGKEIKD